MKTIDTLIPDIMEVIKGNGGWDATVTKFLADTISEVSTKRFQEENQPRNYLSPSSIGTPCKRKLWYRINQPDTAEALSAEALGTFFYGDLLEAMVIALAMAAGHRVTGLQQKLNVCGMEGSGDCVIDGWVVDVKSSSKYGMVKFLKNDLKSDDPFGYISQLSSYLYGYQDDPTVTTKNKAAFLVVQKDRFKLHLDVYDLSKEVAEKEAEVRKVREVVAQKIPPERMPDVPEGKSGNMKLDTICSYCEFRKHCWPDTRTFLYAGKPPMHLTKVVKEPKVPEAK